ncbi:Helix-turn-helix [Pilibacter termitis]|jgi:transcriptional regulator with XRE-family HTH domain|uniref:Helix-turn-helix n=1 Tax=Pilibacter termitis TaxID=263852 RepID=A0A1T4R1M7_9ENTE|nr:helix-turn-helix transcriptional regulator [Pilibacter termitis]SKA09621.1 Helix-turn-helix [Pilibacter termitis]
MAANPKRNTYFARNITRAREEKKLSQIALAKLLDIAPSNISSWENGRQKPNQKIIDKVADTLDLSLEDLTDDRIIDANLELPPVEKNPMYSNSREGNELFQLNNPVPNTDLATHFKLFSLLSTLTTTEIDKFTELLELAKELNSN